MTSMPLTLRTMLLSLMMFPGSGTKGARRAAPPRIAAASALTVRCVAGRQLLLGRVLGGRAAHQRLDDLLVGLQPVGAELPLLAVPGMDACPGGAHVVDA